MNTRDLVHLMARLFSEVSGLTLPPERLDLMAEFFDLAERLKGEECGLEWLRGAMLARIPTERLADLVAEIRGFLEEESEPSREQPVPHPRSRPPETAARTAEGRGVPALPPVRPL